MYVGHLILAVFWRQHACTSVIQQTILYVNAFRETFFFRYTRELTHLFGSCCANKWSRADHFHFTVHVNFLLAWASSGCLRTRGCASLSRHLAAWSVLACMFWLPQISIPALNCLRRMLFGSCSKASANLRCCSRFPEIAASKSGPQRDTGWRQSTCRTLTQRGRWSLRLYVSTQDQLAGVVIWFESLPQIAGSTCRGRNLIRISSPNRASKHDQTRR